MGVQVGDRVVIHPAHAGRFTGIVFVVEKLLPKNVDIRPEAGGRGVRCASSLLRPAGEAASAVVVEVPIVPMEGTVVRFRGKLCVVIGANRDGRMRLAELGGMGGAWRNVAVREIEVVLLDSILREGV